MKLIGIVGFIGSGKDTVAKQFVKGGCVHDSFANPLKDLCANVFGWDRQMLEGETIEAKGIFYDEDSSVEFVGGFEPLKASGQVAKGTVIRNIESITFNQGRRQVNYSYYVNIESGGVGYSTAPRVSFTNAPPGMAGIATINPNTGAVDSVQITNMGQNLTTPYDPIITFTGGLNYSEILITAEVEDLDKPNSVSAVSFYVNGTLMDDSQSIDSNPDAKAPYQILWSPEGPGIYEIYAAAEDSDGNVYTSSVIRREAFLSQPPYVEFNPMDRAYGYVLPDNIDENVLDGISQAGSRFGQILQKFSEV